MIQFILMKSILYGCRFYAGAHCASVILARWRPANRSCFVSFI